MNRLKIAAGLAAVLAASLLLAPGSAAASCSDRKATGTVVGGVGGALIGNSISRGGGGAILGGLGGAVLGHEIARGTCGHERRAEYRRRYYRGYGPYPTGDRFAEAQPQPQPMIGYYDERGNLVGQGAPPGAARGGRVDAPPGAAPCGIQPAAYYDDRGILVQRPAQPCVR